MRRQRCGRGPGSRGGKNQWGFKWLWRNWSKVGSGGVSFRNKQERADELQENERGRGGYVLWRINNGNYAADVPAGRWAEARKHACEIDLGVDAGRGA